MKEMNDNGALIVLCGPLLCSLHHSQLQKAPSLTSSFLHYFTPMEFRTRNGFNLDDDDTSGEFPLAGDDRKRRNGAGSSKRGAPGAGGAAPPSCQADSCTAVLTDAKRYHRRHKVCEYHSKSAVVIVSGLRQRFCQQCSRFHELLEFDEAKRSCRRRLAGHNERRRKSTSAEPGEGSIPATIKLGSSSSSSGQMQCRIVPGDENNRGSSIRVPNSGNSGSESYKHFQIG